MLDSSIKCPLCRSVTFISGGRAQVDLNIRTDYDFMALIDHVKLSTCQATVPQAPTAGPSAKAGVPIKELHSDQLERATLILSSSTESTTDFSHGGKEKSLTSAKGKALKKPQFRKIKKTRRKGKRLPPVAIVILNRLLPHRRHNRQIHQRVTAQTENQKRSLTADAITLHRRKVK